MRWERRGLILPGGGSAPWAATHASNPVARVAADGSIKLFASMRDRRQRSHVVVVRLDRRWNVVGAPTLLVAPGPIGAFDDSGATMGSIEEHDGRAYLHYMGWHLRDDVPWANTIGTVELNRGLDRVERRDDQPSLGLGDTESSLTYPWAVGEQRADESRRWLYYGSCEHWGSTIQASRFVLRRARFEEGGWVPEQAPVLRLVDDEFAVTRPCVWREGTGWRMIFSRRRLSSPDSYELGSATSPDGRDWRREPFELLGEAAAWESDMQCYATRVEMEGREWLVYNGNGFGRTGVGVAERVA